MNYFDALAAMQKPQNSVWSNAGLFNTSGYLPGLFDMQYQPRIDQMPLFAAMRYHPLADAVPGMTDLPYLPVTSRAKAPQLPAPAREPKYSADELPPVERVPPAPIEDKAVLVDPQPSLSSKLGINPLSLGMGLLNSSLNPSPPQMTPLQFAPATAHRGQYIPVDQFLGLLGGR